MTGYRFHRPSESYLHDLKNIAWSGRGGKILGHRYTTRYKSLN